MATGWWWSQSISPSFCYQFVHDIILSDILHWFLFVWYIVCSFRSKQPRDSNILSSSYTIRNETLCLHVPVHLQKNLLASQFFQFTIQNSIELNQQRDGLETQMQICSGVFTTQYHFLLFGITLANMHPGWAIALSFIAAGWFGRRSFIRRDSTPTTYGNFWKGIKLVQIPNNAVCLNVYPKQKMMYIQLSWKICPKLLQSQAYSCTSITIQDLSWKPEYYELIAKHIADAGQILCCPQHLHSM